MPRHLGFNSPVNTQRFPKIPKKIPKGTSSPSPTDCKKRNFKQDEGVCKGNFPKSIPPNSHPFLAMQRHLSLNSAITTQRFPKIPKKIPKGTSSPFRMNCQKGISKIMTECAKGISPNQFPRIPIHFWQCQGIWVLIPQ